jgi:hypothetical protein
MNHPYRLVFLMAGALCLCAACDDPDPAGAPADASVADTDVVAQASPCIEHGRIG